MSRGPRMPGQGEFHCHYCRNCGHQMTHGGPASSCLIERGLRPPLVCRVCEQPTMASKAKRMDRPHQYKERVRRKRKALRGGA